MKSPNRNPGKVASFAIPAFFTHMRKKALLPRVVAMSPCFPELSSASVQAHRNPTCSASYGPRMRGIFLPHQNPPGTWEWKVD